MENNQANNPTIDKVWQFVRGDMRPAESEQWMYSDSTVEQILGKDLFLDVVSTDFSSKDEVFRLKEILKEFALSQSSTSCLCSQLSNIAAVDMGEDSEEVFRTLEEIRRRGDPYWWLSVCQCSGCQQSWLVAQEERQNDLFCLYRLDASIMEDVLNNDRWPSIFDDYEVLIRISVIAGKRVYLFDPPNSPLRWTISDLARHRPGINTSEIAELLNFEIDLAEEQPRNVVREGG